MGRIVACAPAISRVSFSFSDRRRTPQSERAAAAVATGSAASSEHGGVSRSGHAGWHRCVRRIGRGHGAAGASRGVPPKKSSPRRLGRPTNRRFPSPTRLRSPQNARREASGARTRRTRRRAIRVSSHDVLTRSTRPRGRPLTVSSPPNFSQKKTRVVDSFSDNLTHILLTLANHERSVDKTTGEFILAVYH